MLSYLASHITRQALPVAPSLENYDGVAVCRPGREDRPGSIPVLVNSRTQGREWGGYLMWEWVNEQGGWTRSQH